MLSVRLPRRVAALVLSAICLSCIPAFAQMPGAGVSAALLQLFGANTNFTAKATMEVRDQSNQVLLKGPMDAAMLNGSFRMELDISKLGGSQVAALSAVLKMAGMERLTTVIRVDKRETILFSPTLQAVVKTPFSDEEVAAITHPPKATLKELGKENLEGVAVIKQQFTSTTGKEKLEATLWLATALKDFPLQIEVPQGPSTLLLKFADVKLTKPPAGLFEAPKGYTVCADLDELMQSGMKKAAGGK